MLAEDKKKKFDELVSSLSNDELIWVNGFLNGMVSGKEQPKPQTSVKSSVNKITIAYGTETGNSKKVATDFAAKAKKSGISVKLVSLEQYRLNDLTKEEYFFTIISTHGDGEPPAAAKKFHDYIHNNGFKIDNLKYSVLALGDTSYPLFCKTGEEVDEQLMKLGGKRISPLAKCDVEFDEEANAWVEKALQTIIIANPENAPGAPALSPAALKKPAGRKINTGSVISNINLNDVDSHKETYHIEIAVEETEYEPGDSIGIVPPNPLKIVDEILSYTTVDKNTEVRFKEEVVTVFDLLKSKVNIIQITPSVVKKYAALVDQIIPEGKFDLIDLLHKHPVKNAAQFLDALLLLSPIAPRLYTIASSPEAHIGEVHLTVEKDHFTINDEVKFGLCSEYLGLLPVDSKLNFFVQKNKRFRLPADDKDIIMIGPGTGIAAFRSFLAERDAKGATGRNWLFFGEEHFVSDFLYQTEIQNWLDIGVLTRVNVAFSNDQAENLYVHHKMLEQAQELFAWIEQGAYVYVCGQKDPMSVHVENTLLQIIETIGNKTGDGAKNYFAQMKDDGRYSKDVY